MDRTLYSSIRSHYFIYPQFTLQFLKTHRHRKCSRYYWLPYSYPFTFLATPKMMLFRIIVRTKALYHIKFDFFACNDFEQKPEPSTKAYRACTERFFIEVSQFIEAHEDRFGNESLDTRYFCGKDMEFVYMQLPKINFLSKHFMTLFTDDNQKAVFYLLSRCSQKVY
ncbi:unnamed protein product [Albugo candida]|uniref:Uncharacterized protein n=1 Tax=Albugo candida TaxID=65357 RepID=A0A024FUN5_9STRA|nr:unnamed protein product [Albugo candida]|eukprot:CCI10622.1 unnamed protein product [Albugo candida]